jgi:methylated-DNA-[protein]-cysteine S-methyltransferase
MNERNGILEIASPVGHLLVAAGEQGLTHVLFAHRTRENPRRVHRTGGEASPAVLRVLAETEKQLREYFAGRRRSFDLPLAARGTEFQRAVWSGLCDIPFGETVSYGELAARVGRAGAVRAVGAANGANPISIIVPCHRVIGRNRRLTGYGGGMDAKKTLLELEGATVFGDRVA